MLLFSATVASRCFRSHGYGVTSDLDIALPRKVGQKNMAHCVLHLIDVECGVSAHYKLFILVFSSEPLYTIILQPAVGDRLAHLLALRACERLFP